MHNFTYDDWKQFFPFSQPRPEQVKAINCILDAFINQNKRFFICEIGTGGGKSAIGLTVARMLDKYAQDDEFVQGAYFLTTQKILQEQYVHDFGGISGRMKSLKSSSNYQCTGITKGESCASGQRIMNGNSGIDTAHGWKTCMFNCAYKRARRDFIESREGVTNFAYFLASTQYTDKLKPRRFLVVDEAHNSDSVLSRFIEITLTEKFAYETLKLKLPQALTQAQAVRWVRDVYQPKLAKYMLHVEGVLEQHQGLKDKLKEFSKFARLFEQLDKHVCQINRFLKLYDSKNWVMNEVDASGRAGRRIEFKPIDVSPFSEDFLFRMGERVLLMSATILNKDGFCELLGIDKNDAAFISLPSPFPVQNKPILVSPAGSMSARTIDETLPHMIKMVKTIMAAHPNERGVVHCHSWKIANYLKKNLHSRRILIHDSDNREEILHKHVTSSSGNTVLLSPSMAEGIDLKDDAGRFTIICKVPYPFLGDKLVKKRMYRWKWWYSLETVRKLVQSVGRSVRSKDDYAVTYILDADFDRVLQRDNNIFPQDFKDAIQ